MIITAISQGQKPLAGRGLSAVNLHLKPGMSGHVLFDDILGTFEIHTSLFSDNLDGFNLVAFEQRRFRGRRKRGLFCVDRSCSISPCCLASNSWVLT